MFKPLFIILLCALLVGGGWSYFIFGGSRSLVFRSAVTFLLSSAIASLSWSWVYGLGGAIESVNIVIVISSFLGWIAAWFKYRKNDGDKLENNSRQPNKSDAFFMLIATFAIFFVGLFPKMDSPTSLTMAIRTGPDAIGTSIASDALFRNGTMHDLKLKIVEDSAFKSFESLSDPNFRYVYSVPSFSSQVKSEFVLSANRWGGSAAISANVLSLIGLKHLWSVLALLSSLSVLFGTFMIFECLRANKISVWIAGACSIAGSVNVNFLHVWNEGGILQSWVFISLASIFFVLFTPSSDFSVNQKSIMTSSAVIVLFIGHFDMMMITLVFLSIFFFLSLIHKYERKTQKDSNVLIIATVVGLISSGPYFLTSINYLRIRISELGPGGWAMPVSPRLAEVFGLFNSFNLAYPSVGRTSNGGFAVEFLGFGLLIFMTIIYLENIKIFNRSFNFIFSIFIVFGIVAFKTFFIDKINNYQYVKAVGFFAPLLFPLLGLMTKDFVKHNIVKKFILLLLCLLTFLASTNYILNYRKTSTRFSHKIPEQLLASNRDLRLDSLDIVSASIREVEGFSPFVSLRWVNRGTNFGVPLKFRSHKEIGVIISVDNCSQWSCTKNVDNERVLDVTEDFKLLRLGAKSSVLFDANGRIKANYIDIINSLSLELGGPRFDSDLKVAP